MNNKRILMFILLSILALAFTSAFRPPPVKQISLLSVSYLREKGVTFKFQADGDISKSDMKGKVLVAGKTIRLFCNYSGDPTPVIVVCTADKGTAVYAGRSGVVSIAGRVFWFIVPARLTK